MALPLHERLRRGLIPMLLAGPILRRAEPGEVSVWVALRDAQKVTLRIYERDSGYRGSGQRMEGTARTIRVGERLHLALVTARPPDSPDEERLERGTLYRYNVFFGEDDGTTTPVVEDGGLWQPGIVHAEGSGKAPYSTFLYSDGPTLPSFALAADKTRLRLVHGSCRKPHGDGVDALSAVDTMIQESVTSADDRPHSLLLTGDQIYADDVADALLALLIDVGPALLGWDETLPQVETRGRTLPPGRRERVVTRDARLTSGEILGLPIVPRLPTAKSHLLTFGEFCAMYLFAWSNTLWPDDRDPLPTYDALFPKGDADRAHFEEDTRALGYYIFALPAVRRVLANVPTYMIFDDHEVTDDWYFNAVWCERVFGTRLGRYVLRSGIAAYALFQGWGNAPTSQFGPGAPGSRFLTALERWTKSKGKEGEAELERFVGPPQLERTGDLVRLPHDADALDFHYWFGGPGYQVIVLDTRTWRTSERAVNSPPFLLYGDVYDRQLEGIPPPGPDDVVFVVSPAPFVGPPLIERGREALGALSAFFTDQEDWGLTEAPYEQFLSALLTRGPVGADGRRRTRVVVLSGDVHYGFAAMLRYHADKPHARADAGPTEGVLVQLTASPLKNLDLAKEFHTMGYEIGNSLPWLRRAGWDLAEAPLQTVGSYRTLQIRRTGHESDVERSWLVAGSPARVGWSSREVETGRMRTANVVNVQVTRRPHWDYRIEYLLADADGERDVKPTVLTLPPIGDRRTFVKNLGRAAAAHDAYRERWGPGKEIVGLNNVADVRLKWGPREEDKAVVQRLWWAPDNSSAPRPLTKHTISLALLDDPTAPTVKIVDAPKVVLLDDLLAGRARVALTLDASGDVEALELEVLDAAGRRLGSFAIPAATGSEYAWDGSLGGSTKVSVPGTYKLRVLARVGANVVARSDARTVKLLRWRVTVTSAGHVDAARPSGSLRHHVIAAAGPTMPALVVKALLEGLLPQQEAALARELRLRVAYARAGRNDVVMIPGPAVTDFARLPAGTLEWKPAWGKRFCGGALVVFCRATVDGVTLEGRTDPDAHVISGMNPTRPVVRAAIPELNMKVVAHAESRFTQFRDSSAQLDRFEAGPFSVLFRPNDGFGVGQLLAPPPTISELWNWRENVRSMIGRLSALRRRAVAYQEQVRKGQPFAGEAGKPPNPGKAFPNAPAFTSDQLDLEMWARYNGGYRYHDYDSRTNRWVRRPARNEAVTSLPYAETLLATRKQVQAGQTPRGWL
jgi:hypothetical protein